MCSSATYLSSTCCASAYFILNVPCRSTEPPKILACPTMLVFCSAEFRQLKSRTLSDWKLILKRITRKYFTQQRHLERKSMPRRPQMVHMWDLSILRVLILLLLPRSWHPHCHPDRITWGAPWQSLNALKDAYPLETLTNALQVSLPQAKLRQLFWRLLLLSSLLQGMSMWRGNLRADTEETQGWHILYFCYLCLVQNSNFFCSIQCPCRSIDKAWLG